MNGKIHACIPDWTSRNTAIMKELQVDRSPIILKIIDQMSNETKGPKRNRVNALYQRKTEQRNQTTNKTLDEI